MVFLTEFSDCSRSCLTRRIIFQARSVDDISQPALEQVNGYVATVTTTMHSALDTLSETYLLKWLVPEYHNIGSLDIHMH